MPLQSIGDDDDDDGWWWWWWWWSLASLRNWSMLPALPLHIPNVRMMYAWRYSHPPSRKILNKKTMIGSNVIQYYPISWSLQSLQLGLRKPRVFINAPPFVALALPSSMATGHQLGQLVSHQSLGPSFRAPGKTRHLCAIKSWKQICNLDSFKRFSGNWCLRHFRCHISRGKARNMRGK